MKFIPLVLVFSGLGLRHLALWCVYGLASCPATNFFHAIFLEFINPLYTFSIFFVVPALGLVFVKQHTFKSWLHLATWFIPLSILVIALTPTSSHAWMPLYFVGKDTTTLILAGTFTVVSLLIILCKQFGWGKKLSKSS